MSLLKNKRFFMGQKERAGKCDLVYLHLELEGRLSMSGLPLGSELEDGYASGSPIQQHRPPPLKETEDDSTLRLPLPPSVGTPSSRSSQSSILVPSVAQSGVMAPLWRENEPLMTYESTTPPPPVLPPVPPRMPAVTTRERSNALPVLTDFLCPS